MKKTGTITYVGKELATVLTDRTISSKLGQLTVFDTSRNGDDVEVRVMQGGTSIRLLSSNYLRGLARELESIAADLDKKILEAEDDEEDDFE